ncbi:hypothetical protein IAU59_000224 [Kwoniella sp. CBS 9459]
MPRNDRKAGPQTFGTTGPSSSGARPGYCQSCGRLLPSDTRSDPTPRKYCSNSCRSHAKSPYLRSIRQNLIQSYHRYLSESSSRSTRTVILCSQVERDVFGPSAHVARGEPDQASDRGDGNSVGVGDGNDDGDAAASAKRLEPAEEREEARRAARRIVAFGFISQGVEEEREVEAVQDAKTVETSFAKGEWGIRWKS